jgi:protein pelota
VRGFYDQIGDALLLHVKPELIKCLLIASSGQLRDELMAHLQTKLQRDDCKPALRQLMTAKDKFVLLQISSNASLRETLALPEVQKRMENARGSDDLKAWNRFQEVINTDPDFAAYGVQYVFTAHHEHHAIELLLLTDAVFRGEARQRTFFTAFVDDIKEYGGQVVILSSKHVVAEQLHAMGDIAAVLRLPLPDLDTQVVPDPNFVAASDEVTAYVAARKKIHMAATAMGTASASLVSSPVTSTPGRVRFPPAAGGAGSGPGSAMGTPMPSNTF